MTTFPEVLARRLAEDSSRPLITYYDAGSGERTELSVATYANWVAKAGSLLVEEHDLGSGSRLLLDLPAHWLGPVLLGAAWSCGIEVVWEGAADGVVTGPEGLDRWTADADRIPVLACALLPLGVRFAEPLPIGVHDVGVEVWSQPDSYVAWPAPEASDAAVDGLTQGELWRAAAAGSHLSGGGRLLSETNPASPSGLASLTEPLACSGSLVLVVRADPEQIARIAVDEHVTDQFTQGPGQDHPARS